MEKIYHANTNKTKAGMASLISDNAGFRAQNITVAKDHFITLKGLIHQEQITILNVYVPNIFKEEIPTL